jgi:hypothetical protein
MKLKKTLITRDIHDYTLREDLANAYQPKAGDVAMFEIIEIGKHQSVQSDQIRNVAIFPGDRILAAWADRYATSQYEGYVPTEFFDEYHILGAGGAIGIVKSKNASLDDIEPTTVKLVGYCCNESGEVINSKFYKKERVGFNGTVPNNAKIVLSIGSTMDSGKTTTAAFTARGLKATGKNVAFIKFTGTAYSKDKDFVNDCGADVTCDFSDMGYPSTFMCEKADLLDVYQSLLKKLEPHKPDYIVMEIADGLLQRETSFLLQDKAFMSTIHSVVFSCGDSLSAIHGVEILAKYGIKPCVLSGRFTMSPLLIEEVKNYLGLPVLTIDEIMTGDYNHHFLN